MRLMRALAVDEREHGAAQHEALTARELMQEIELSDVETLHSWMGRLSDLGLVHTSGRTK
jgi:hypothetical protein